MIMNAISAVRTAENLELPFANDLWLWPIPTGPRGRLSLGQYTSVYSIWRFAKNQDAAEKFIADLCINYQPATLASKLFNFPSFPGAVPLKKLYETAAADTQRRAASTRSSRRWRRSTRATSATPGTPTSRSTRAHEVPHPPDVRPGVPGQAERSRVGAGDPYELKRIWRKWKAAGKLESASD